MSHKSALIPVLLTRISQFLLFSAIAMLATMTGLILLQVYCRNFLDLGLPWADELARFCGIALVFLAAPQLLIENKHIRMDLVIGLLPKVLRGAVERLNSLLLIGFCSLMLFSFYKFLLRAGKFSTPSLGMPNMIFYLPALIGVALLGLIALYRLFCKPAIVEDAGEEVSSL